MKKLTFTFIALCLATQLASAQQLPPNKWGVEADLLVPFVPEANIITARVTHTIVGRPGAAHGDLLLGVYLRPNVTHDIVDKIDEYLLTAGYRQYLIKGFHIEGQVDTGWARGTRNKIDGKDYENFTVLVEGHAGYKFNFRSNRSYNFYLLPQVGVIQGAVTDIGPRGGKSDTFLSAKVHIGVAF